MQWLLYLLTVISGVLNPVQSGLTGSLEKALDRPFLVAVVSLSGSLLCALLGALVTGQLGWPTEKAAGAPWWAWLAGLAGFVLLIARPYAAPRLGAAPFTGLTVTASVVFSVLLDQYGLLGFEQHAAGWGRISAESLADAPELDALGRGPPRAARVCRREEAPNGAQGAELNGAAQPVLRPAVTDHFGRALWRQ